MPRYDEERPGAAARFAEWAGVFARVAGVPGQRREEQAAALPADRVVAPSAARFASWADVFARARAASPGPAVDAADPPPAKGPDPHGWGKVLAREAARA
jgi:hypothetical protein